MSVLIWGWSPHSAIAAKAFTSGELQSLIDRTAEGDTLFLSEGSYRGPVIIRKPISIEGKGSVEISGTGEQAPVIQIDSDQVTLRNLKIIQPSDADDNAALQITGNNALLEALNIDTSSYGIVLRDGGQHEISNTTIRWIPASSSKQSIKLSDKRNGIDLFNSHGNRIHKNRISQMNDGIYLESSNRNIVENNKVDHSRYGIHCMYTNETVVRGNMGEFNVTGAMIMGVRDAEVTGNRFVKQSENVNSQGLLLFDVQTSRIINNKVEGNRVGLYIEQSHKNEFEHNKILQNFVGIQFLESNQNQFLNNDFVGNVIPAETNESADNRFERNYWDEFHGIDTDGDGLSDLKYSMNPFFQRLTSATPAFQLFFQSPGLQFLESMYSASKEEWTTDKAPLMNPSAGELEPAEYTNDPKVWILGLIMFLGSITLITSMGVKRI
ncbi:nitrous oxide reductase family maturation protein NosD [Paenibacillus sp. OAS669]|uniref:right-handed parallel beta-helix repeat-containing protein n=1 Tax=Paenibacillus sp. OAS669 TaxID=2663821 RepID=UPI00178BE916|nr:NosD domain-containing protein [Paenibacillus sp. OAS669]MBE1445768.1 nitrous oxidase accessory protein [Paenibacillus sp. OAS669]